MSGDMPLALRPYQVLAIEKLRQSYRTRHNAPLLVSPTGSGKTVVIATVAHTAVLRATQTLIVAHRRELIQQAVQKLAVVGIKPAIIAPGYDPDYNAQVQVASIQTAVRRLDKLPPYGLIVVDEAHHSRATQYQRLFASQPQAKLLGVTATPARLDGRGLGKQDGGPFDDLVIAAEVDELIQQDYLAPVHVFVPKKHLDLSGIHTRGGDYNADDLDQLVRGAKITGDAVQEYRERADHQPCLVYCVSIAHAQEAADAFSAAGYRSRMVCGTTPRDERDSAIAGLHTGEVEVLTSCALIDEGLDVPSVGCVILLRPTKSMVLHRQQVGRGMRPAPGKTLVVLDHVGNSIEHELPTTRVMWTLDGIIKKKHGATLTWRCECGALNAMPDDVCDVCGGPRCGKEARERELTTEPGAMIALTHEMLVKRMRHLHVREIYRRKYTRAELTAFAEAHNYHPGWVGHREREQQGLRP
jgi:DNA repair protein RadD